MTYNPNFITKLVTTLAILPIGFGSVPAANAADTCMDVGGGRACVTMFSDYDIIEADIPVLGGQETLRVRCDGSWAYESKGQWAKSTASTFVESYCESRGNVHS
jgi:hypothetical protein